MANKKLNKGSAGQNRKAGDDFQDKYRQKSDVQKTASGLLYRMIEQGQGASPAMTDRVVVHQRIQTVNNKLIADTYKDGDKDEFALKEAIPGLQEGLQLMQEGARYEFVVPPELAWGKRGVGSKIGPNAVLIFDLRLVEVKFAQ